MPKILVIRFSSIGDIVLTSPVIRCIKHQLKDAEIHYLTKESFASILNANPYINKVHAIKHKVAELIPVLRKERYDYIVDLHHNLRTKQILWSLRRPAVSFRKLNPEKWLLVNFHINKLPELHIVDRYLEAALPLAVHNDHKGLDFFIPPAHELMPQTLPQSHRAGFIALVIGAQHFTKRLPNNKLVEICKKIHMPVILIGGKEDTENADFITREVGDDKVYNACGRYSLFASASIIKQAVLVITHDTGMMHIAAAFNKKIISVWGNTVPEFGMTPYMPQCKENSYVAEVKNLSCRPCSKIGKPHCPKAHFSCMNDIDLNNILKQAVIFSA